MKLLANTSLKFLTIRYPVKGLSELKVQSTKSGVISRVSKISIDIEWLFNAKHIVCS